IASQRTVEPKASNIPKRRFISGKATKQFCKINKPLIQERGFNFSIQLFHDPIITMVEYLKWSTFYRQPLKPIVILVVQEFYANFLESLDQKVRVRDVIVDASPTAIEAIHKTPRYNFDFYENLHEEEDDYDIIIQVF
ncbi:hypothetical protein V6Z11_A10G189700, partial [Gossypium hirsutum]